MDMITLNLSSCTAEAAAAFQHSTTQKKKEKKKQCLKELMIKARACGNSHVNLFYFSKIFFQQDVVMV